MWITTTRRQRRRQHFFRLWAVLPPNNAG